MAKPKYEAPTTMECTPNKLRTRRTTYQKLKWRREEIQAQNKREGGGELTLKKRERESFQRLREINEEREAQ